MKSKLMVLKSKSIAVTGNVRYVNNYDISNLTEDIRENGLQTRLEVRDLGDGTFELLRGHRRLQALQVLKYDDIPCIVWQGMTDAEAMLWKVDAGNVKGLSLGEAELACHMLMDAGITAEKPLILKLAGLFDSLSPMSGDRRKKRDDALAAGDIATADKITFEYRRGLIAPMIQTYSLPEIVKNTRYYHGAGVWPEGCEVPKNYPSKLTNADVRELAKAHSMDLEVRDSEGAPAYSKDIPGPAFLAAWKVFCERVVNSKTTSPAMQLADIVRLVETGSISNAFGVQLVDMIKAGQDEERLKALVRLNRDLVFVDMIRKHDKKAYAEMIDAGKAIAKQIASSN